jgi:hypothetical protein
VASEPLRSILKKSGLYRNEVIPQFAYVLNLDLELTAGRVIANPMAIDASPDVSLKSAATTPRAMKDTAAPEQASAKKTAATKASTKKIRRTKKVPVEGNGAPRLRRVPSSVQLLLS